MKPPFKGLSSVVNVLGRVGPGEANSLDDVKVVQQLLQMCSKGSTNGINVPNVTGRFDAATGFWIYHTQKVNKNAQPGQIVDGVVSPAHGEHYGPTGIWTIVIFNYLASQADPTGYKTFVASQT